MFGRKKKKISAATEVTDSNFNELVTQSEIPVLIDFWAAWCGPCKVMNPIIEELSSEYKDRVLIGKVNVDRNPGLSQFFQIKSIPTFVFIKNGRLVERISQMIPKPNLEEMLEDLILLEVADSSEEE